MAASCSLVIYNYQLPTTNYQLPTTNPQCPIPNSQCQSNIIVKISVFIVNYL
ncbi:MAG: hypothetical protein AAF630_13675 [Cyanobacteria bacterium P01_C01_bin.38]